MASSVLSPGNTQHWNSHITFVETNSFRKTLHIYCTFWRCTLQKMVYINKGLPEIFHWLNLSGRTMALGSSQPSKEMSTRWYLLGGVKVAGV
jgi:hypothetical protein